MPAASSTNTESALYVCADLLRGCKCPLLGVEGEDDLDSVLDAVASLSLLGRGMRPSMATPDALDNFSDTGFRLML